MKIHPLGDRWFHAYEQTLMMLTVAFHNFMNTPVKKTSKPKLFVKKFMPFRDFSKFFRHVITFSYPHWTRLKIQASDGLPTLWNQHSNLVSTPKLKQHKPKLRLVIHHVCKFVLHYNTLHRGLFFGATALSGPGPHS